MNKEHNKIDNSAWERTRFQHLFRFKATGTIFARFKVRGKQVRKSLKTSNLELAKNKLAELERCERAIAEERRRGRLLFGEALDEFLRSRNADPTLKPGTKSYDEQRVKALLQSWPALENLDVRRITKDDCEKWAKDFAQAFAPSVYNHTLGIVKHVFRIAIDRGVRYDDPARSLKRQTDRPKKLTLPSCDQFKAFILTIETGGSGKSKPCAELVRFLAFSGLRKAEASHVTWGDINFHSGTIRVLGDPTNGTKNGEFRTIPMLPEMRQLLLSLKTIGPEMLPEHRVMRVQECQKAMDRAAEIVGMPRITHHDLRHLFATRCIESGVDVLTVSRWLGHRDGGMLAMKVYGHLRDEHSVAMAQKVYFGEKPLAG